MMSTEVAVPDVVKPLLHSLGPSRSPPKVRLHDSSIHGGFLEDMPHVRTRLDAR